MKHLIRSRALASVLLVALLIAACGRDDAGETGAEPTDTETEMTETETETATETEASGEITTDVGVTEEACPDAVNADNGCIYLGILSDLTEGPFRALAVPITDAQEAFWNRVNEQGGIGGFDVNVTEYTRDNKYNPEVHNQVYQEIKPNILAIAQTLGSPTTAAILDDLKQSNVVAVPASWTSLWLFEDVLVESGSTYCIDAMNGLDYVAQEGEAGSVIAIALPGDYGGDGAAGAKIWAETNGADFTYVEQTPVGLGGTTTAAVDTIVQQDPDVVHLTLTPAETAEIIGNAVARGYQGRFVGAAPTFNPGLLQSPAKDAIVQTYLNTSPWSTTFGGDVPAAQAMRDALGDVQPSEGYTQGWAWSYSLKAALERAAENGDLTRKGLLDAVTSLTEVDYEGMLPAGAGNYSGTPNEMAVRTTSIGRVTEESVTGIELIERDFTGPTAEAYQFEDGACYQTVSLG